jgi:hypothetical protein
VCFPCLRGILSCNSSIFTSSSKQNAKRTLSGPCTPECSDVKSFHPFLTSIYHLSTNSNPNPCHTCAWIDVCNVLAHYLVFVWHFRASRVPFYANMSLYTLKLPRLFAKEFTRYFDINGRTRANRNGKPNDILRMNSWICRDDQSFLFW